LLFYPFLQIVDYSLFGAFFSFPSVNQVSLMF